MTRLTVLLAHRSSLIGVVDILRDWAALGVVGEVFAVAIEDVVSGVQVGAYRIGAPSGAAGASRRVLLADELASRHDVELVRLGVLDLSAWAPQFDEAEAGLVRAYLSRVLPHVRLVAVHLLAPQHTPTDGLHWRSGAGLWAGWHNVIIAPENSAAPSAGLAPVVAQPDSPLGLTHPVAAACGVLGALSGHTDSLFDDRQYLPGEQAFVARTFTRYLSAEAVNHEVLVRTTDVRDRYPVPRREGQPVLVVDDELDASLGMAERLLTRHREVFAGERPMPQRTPPTRIGPMAALGMFFSFFLAALRNAPRAFVAALVRRTQAAIAREVGDFVFGASDSSFTVVVGGIGADGRPVALEDLDTALDQLADQAGANLSYRPANLSALWHDYVAGALTLLDAGAREPELPPLAVGAHQAVVSSTARVVPAPGEAFELSPDVAAYLPGWRIEGADLARAALLDQRLAGLGREQGQLTEQLAGQRRALADWVAGIDGYTARVGQRLATAMHGTFAEIAALNDQLRRVGDTVSLPANTDDRQRQLGRTLLLIAGAALLLIVVCVLLTVYVPMKWYVGVAICLVIVAGWLAGSLSAFMHYQRAIFALLHQREEDARLSTVLRAHLREALDDGRRLSRAYRQFLDFSRALAVFAHAPLGMVPQSPRAELLIGPGLPRNVMIGVADASEQTIADSVDALRRNLFEAGWLSEGWAHFLDDLPSGLGPWQYQLREQPDALWSDPRIDATGSVLTAWSHAVTEHAGSRGVPRAFVARFDALLEADHAGVTTALRQRVRVRRSQTGEETVLDYRDFVAGLATVDGRRCVFDSVLFAESPEHFDPARVDDTVVQRAGSGLALSLVVTQLSAGLQAVDLAGSPASPRPQPKLADVDHLPPV